MDKIQVAFNQAWDSFVSISPNLLAGLMVLGIFAIVGFSVGRVINTRLRKKWTESVMTPFIGGLVKWVLITLGAIVALHMAGFGGLASSIVAGAGVSALIVGFALKDIAENFLAGVLLAINRPFKLGDIIECVDYKGPVQKLDLRTTHIRTVDGRDIYIPNGLIVKNVFINFTRDGLLRQEFMVGLDTNDDLSRARNVLLEYFAKQPDVLSEPRPNLVVDEIGESSINVKVLFWVDILNKKHTEDASDTGESIRSRVIRETKELFLEHGFNLPSMIVEHKMYQDQSPLRLEVMSKST